MSYRLVNANDLSEKYPEVNNMPCIFADLENGLDNKHHFISAGISEEDKDCFVVNWALNELKLAIESLSSEDNAEVRAQSEKCFKSAINAYFNLVADKHSGSTIAVTKQIFNRLVDVMPLTPIEDTDDIWQKIEGSKGGYICKRFTSLTKYIDKNGKVTYHDSRRSVCMDIPTGSRYNSGFVDGLIDQLLPISMPYNPSSKKIIVRTNEVTVGDNWYLGISDAHLPSGENVAIDKYVILNEKAGKADEITEEEFKKVYLEHTKEK